MKEAGLTATRHGCNPTQLQAVHCALSILHSEGYRVLHHGDCVGGDFQGHCAAQHLGWATILHPGLGPASNRAFSPMPTHTFPPLPYLERNKVIVDSTSALVVAPFEPVEQPRGGTWSTLRYARGLKPVQGYGRKKIIVCPPDGSILFLNDAGQGDLFG